MLTYAELAANGFAIVPGVLNEEQVGALLGVVGSVAEPGRGGVRNLLARVPAVRELAESASIRGLVEPVLGPGAFAVRGILFDKTPEANWKVPWHQDLTIAVELRIDTDGFGPWTVKDGGQHVQPPVAILEGMLAVRIHLDDCWEENGPVRVIPGSHVHGRLSGAEIDAMQASTASVSCPVGRGGALLMRPLLLHASSAATAPSHRRVIHLEFAACELPGGISWDARC